MTTIHRRSFLERLGLGAGALLLAPIAESLISEARGDVTPRKRAIFFLHANGMNYDFNFTPPEFKRPNDPEHRWAVMNGPTSYTWPAMLKSLEPYRDRMLLMDGLANVPRSGSHGHSAGYAALSCFPAMRGGANDGNGMPGGITIDQFIAGQIGAATRRKSVLYGVSQREDAQIARVFAGGPDKPEPHFQSPTLLYNDLFGTLATDASGVNRGQLRQRALLDAMRADIRRLQGALAGPERGKLDSYLGAIEDFEKREKASVASCKVTLEAPMAAAPGKTTPIEDKLSAMTDMAILALTCGLTNVVGVSDGCGNSHDNFPRFTRITTGTAFEKGGINGGDIGHAPPATQGPAMDIIHNFHGSLIVRMIQTLSSIKEGDKTLFDNTVILYTSENGEQHHAYHDRWPLVLIGDAGGKLRTDGRFIRYPRKGSTGWRSMSDLYCSLATAVGAPTDSFGKGGNEPVKGPLPEIMT